VGCKTLTQSINQSLLLLVTVGGWHSTPCLITSARGRLAFYTMSYHICPYTTALLLGLVGWVTNVPFWHKNRIYLGQGLGWRFSSARLRMANDI